jgi:hypothetical protein
LLSAILQTTDVALREAKPQRMFVVGGGDTERDFFVFY